MKNVLPSSLSFLTKNETAKAIYKLLFLVLIAFAALPANAQVASKSNMAKQLLQAKPASERPSATDIAEMKVSSETYSKLSGVTHIYFQQHIGGIPVHNAILGAHVTKNNQLLTVTSRFVPEAQSKAANPIPAITSEQAVLAAARQLGYVFSGKLRIKETKGGPEQAVVFEKSTLSLEDIPVKLMWQTLEDSSGIRLRLAWDLSIYEISALNWWSVRVDAQTGEILDKINWVVHCSFGETGEKCSHESGKPHPGKSDILLPEENWNWKKSNDQMFIGGASYRVFPQPYENPHDGPRQLITDPANAIASPFGWHDINGAAGAEYTITRGNNVYAYTDTNANNSPDLNSSPNGGAALVFDYPLDLTQSPSTYRKASVTNLFYWNNFLHDFAYGYGFDELSGNFQQNNYGNGGEDNDYVNAEAQDGGGFTNANFATPPDGYKPRMQMYLGNNISPMTDGDFDNGVIAHEYGHGISNRLTGGPANVSCLGNQEQMGEGWSDFFALMTTLAPGDVGSTPRTEGTYLNGQPANGAGFRPTPYSTDMTINPATYNTIKTAAVPHGVGYVWTGMLWDMAWALMDAHGQTAGYNEAMNLVMEGMKLQPCSPGFVDGRNAILAADVALYGGANQCLIWKAFARRGLGYSALQGSTNSRADGTEAFDLPASCAGIWSVPSANAICEGLTATYVINSSAAIAGGDLTLTVSNLPAGTNVSFAPATLTPGSTSTLTLTAATTLPGNYVITVTGTNGSGSFSTDINFTVYLMPAVPVLVSPANGATGVYVRPTLTWNAVPGATSYRLQFSTSPTFATTLVSGTLTATSYTYPNFITEGTPYYWHVQAIGPKCTSAYSVTYTFTGGCSAYATIGAPTLLSPANGATGVSVSPLLDWSDVATAEYYIGQIATDAGFTNIIANWTVLSSNTYPPVPLNTNTQYFWRVRANNTCNPVPVYSSVFSFTTNGVAAVCNNQASTNVPVAISTIALNTVTSTINISTCGTVADINLLNLDITHPYIGALEIELTSPSGTTVKVFDNACSAFDNMLISFDDEAANSYFGMPCPPTGNGVYTPFSLLSAFDGESITGTWTLSLRTTLNPGIIPFGSLNSWSLGFCYTGASGTIVTCYRDADNDLFGNPAISESSCTTCRTGWVQNNTDCDDSNPAITAAVTVTCYKDVDGDGFGDLADSKQFCAACGVGYAANSNDCDVNNPDIHPGATEVCNGIDDDCDGLIDEGFDADSDGFSVCQGDCNDNNPAIYPGAPEICDGLDNNCNGFVDEVPVAVTYTAINVPVTIPAANSGTVTSTLVLSGITGNIIDLDVLNLNITHSYISDMVIELTSPQGTTVRLIDQPCEDQNNILINFDNESPNTQNAMPCPPINNGTYKAFEPLSAFYGQNPNGTWTLTVHDIYNGDGGSINAWKLKISTPGFYYQDLDQDGYGNPAVSVATCTPGYVTNSSDCNDNNATVYAGAPEICDGLDNDCNGLTDETFTITNHAATNVPVTIPTTAATVTSTMVVSGIGPVINDLNLSNLNISHTYINDLKIDITSPQGTTVRLISNICGSQDNMLINFDDESADSYASIPCPPVNNGTYKPFQPLSAFDGQDPNGTWTLTVIDGFGDDGGAINAWTLNINTQGQLVCPNNLTINNVTHDEGNSGPTTYTFTVSLSLPAPAGGVTFDIATQDNSATTANNDYALKSLTSQFIPEGSSTYTFDVTVNGDNNIEADETFFVNVTNATGATIADGQGLGTINNDDNSIATSLTLTSVTNPSCVGNVATFDATLTRTSAPAGPLAGQTVTFSFSGPGSFSLSATTDGTGKATVQTNFAIAGSYTVTASFANAGYDPSSDVLTQVVNSAPTTPTVTPGGPTTFCAGGSVTLTSSSATGNQWYIDGNAIDGATNQTYVASASGTYAVIVTNGGCSPSAPSTGTVVTVNALPTPQVTAFYNDEYGPSDLSVCSGTTIQLSTQDIISPDLHISFPVSTNFHTGYATFGPLTTVSPINGNIVYIQDGSASYLGCNPYTAGSLTGKVALIDRGVCNFTVKVLNAQNAGAIGVIVVNNNAGGVVNMSGANPSITIPSIFISQADGLMIKNWLTSGVVTGNSAAAYSSYVWSTGATTPTISVSPTVTTTYSVTVTDANGCSGTDEMTITIAPDETPPTIECPANITVNNDNNQCGATVTYAATATDNCSTPTISYSPASGSFFPVGTTTVTATATDEAGLTASCTFTVTVADAQNPTITCPANITVNNDANQCGAVVTYAATASDNCPGVSVGYSPASGSFFPVGTTTVTATATDANNNTSSCTFTVTVVDVQNPTITCPANITVNNDANQCGAVVTYTATASDNCPGVSVSYSPASGSFFPVGTTTVTATATDAIGRTSSCTFTVTVVDAQNPSITCPPNITQNNDNNQCGAVVTYAATATDNCPGVSVSYSPASGSFFPVGTTTVTATATDAIGRTSSCTFTVTVVDAQNPSITCPANIAVNNDNNQCGAVVTYSATATDNCPGVSVSYSPASGSFFPVGTTTVTATATDAAGRTSTCTFTVTVVDAQNPSITCPANVTRNNDADQCGAVVTYAATASDNCPGVSVSYSPASGSFFPVGTTTVTATATDAAGRTSTCTFTVTVVDAQNPTITCPANITKNNDPNQCGAVVTYAATASDNCPGVSVSYSPASGSFFPVGTTTVTATATDAVGRTASCTFTVTVVDAQNPTITCPANITVNSPMGQCGTVVTYAATASDNCPGVTVSYSPASGSTFPAGTTTVTATATDASGRTATCTFTVTVVDTQNPTITCPANIVVSNTTGQCGAFVSFAATANDNCPGVTVSYSKAPGSFFAIGTTTVTATATDAGGRTATCTFTVKVTDTQAPTLTCPPNVTETITSGCSKKLTPPNPTVSDNCGLSKLTWRMTGANSGNSASSGINYVGNKTFNAGVTTITYTATDIYGNTSECSFTLSILETVPPSITCPANKTVGTDYGYCYWSHVNLGTPKTSDNCGVASVTNNAPAVFPIGTTIVTWTVTDNSGNTRSCNQTITVQDQQAPSVTCPANIYQDAGVNCVTTVTTPDPVYYDNCTVAKLTWVMTGATTGSSPTTGINVVGTKNFNVGTTTITYTVKDAVGNSWSCSFAVTITDKTRPTITCPANITLPAAAGSCNRSIAVPDPTYSDNCGVTKLTWYTEGATNISSPTSGINKVGTKTFNVGVTTVTYNARDAANNAQSCTFTVIVTDNQAPVVSCPAAQTFCKKSNNTYTIPAMTRSDNCSIANTTYQVTGVTTRSGSGTNASGTFNLGVSTITWTVTDASGNTSFCSTNVTIVPANNCRLASIEPTDDPKTPESKPPSKGKLDLIVQDAKLGVTAYPNPTAYYFNVKVKSSSKETVEIRMYDGLGKVVQVKRGAPDQTYRFGDNVVGGIYIIEVRQEGQIATVKVMKE